MDLEARVRGDHPLGPIGEIANAVAEYIVNQNLDRRYKASPYPRKFLESRLNQTRQALEESERRLVACAAANQHVSLSPESTTASAGGDSDTAADLPRLLAETDLASINLALAQAISARIQAEQHWRQAELTPDTSPLEVLANSTELGRWRSAKPSATRLDGVFASGPNHDVGHDQHQP